MKAFVIHLLFLLPELPVPVIVPEPTALSVLLQEIDRLQNLRTGDPVKDQKIEDRQAPLIRQIIGDRLNFF